MSVSVRALLALALLLLACLPAAAAPTLEFAGITFAQADEKSAGRQALREYLPPGQTFEDYSHLLALRRDAPVDFAQYAKVLEKDLRTKFPGSTFEVLSLSEDRLEVEFLIVSDEGQEYNLWHFRHTPQGQLSLQFVVRNRGALAKGFDEALKGRARWQAELRERAPGLEDLLGS